MMIYILKLLRVSEADFGDVEVHGEFSGGMTSKLIFKRKRCSPWWGEWGGRSKVKMNATM